MLKETEGKKQLKHQGGFSKMVIWGLPIQRGGKKKEGVIAG